MLKIEIKTGGAAFHCEDPENNPELDRIFLGNEVGRLFVEIVTKISSGKNNGSIIDLNGNKVGEWSLD